MCFSRFGLTVLLLSFAGLGCSGKMDGVVFLDGNADNSAEAQEQTLANLNLKITRNGELVTTAKTNAQGQFSLNINDPGYYCVEVNEPNLSQSMLQALSQTQIPADAVQTMQSDFSLGPPVGAAAKQVLSSSATPSSSPSQTNPTTPSTTTPPSTSPGTASSTTPSTTTPTPASNPAQADKTASGVVCKNTNDMNLTLQIPVAIDYSADVERMPEHIKQERKSGEIFLVAIPVSIGCTLESFYAPDGLEPLWPINPGDIQKIANIDRSTGRIDFTPAVQSTSVNLPFRVKEDLPTGTYSIKLSPFMLCPGDQRIALREIPIDLIAQPFLEIFQELPSGNQEPTASVTWKIFVKNDGSRRYDVVLSGNASGPVSTLSPETAECHTVGSARIECRASVAPQVTKEFHVATTFTRDLSAPATVSFNASVNIAGSSSDSLTADQADVTVNGVRRP